MSVLMACAISIPSTNNTLSAENLVKCPNIAPLHYPLPEGTLIQAHKDLEVLYNSCKIHDNALVDYYKNVK